MPMVVVTYGHYHDLMYGLICYVWMLCMFPKNVLNFIKSKGLTWANQPTVDSQFRSRLYTTLGKDRCGPLSSTAAVLMLQ